MFNLLKKDNQNDNTLFAPVNGQCIDITKVPDPLFADKVMGEGVAFVYDDDIVYSPCNGRIILIAASKHAIGIKTNSGLDILIHVGIDTVNLEGQGFDVLVSKNQKVKIGTPILRIDRKFMDQQGLNLITPMVLTNAKEYDLSFNNIGNDVIKAESIIIEFIEK